MHTTKRKSKSIERPVTSEKTILFSHDIQELRKLDVNQLIELLKRPDLGVPANASVLREIISILRKRKGSRFVEKLLDELPANAAMLEQGDEVDEDLESAADENSLESEPSLSE